ncbi:MAG: THUMP domain-containing protein [Burkholderiaceae bacterium]
MSAAIDTTPDAASPASDWRSAADVPWRSADAHRPLELFATCPQGLESLLADELAELGGRQVTADSAGASCIGDWDCAVRLNRESRLASRVLLLLAQGPYRNDKDIGRLAATVPWDFVLEPRMSLRVDTRARRAKVRSLNMVTLRIKDAVVDRLREVSGDRPDVDTRSPDVRLMAFVDEHRALIYLDLSGESLFKRGWRGRDDKGAAPLKENLAAALPLLAGWTAGAPLLDPFCGSGTIAIEAAQRIAAIEAGGARRFGFESLPGYRPAQAPAANHNSPRPRQGHVVRPAGTSVFASDIDPKAVGTARANAQRAGVPAAGIGFKVADVRSLQPPRGLVPGWIVTNPPYGERLESLGNDANMLALGRHLRSAFAGWTLAWLTSDRQLPGRLGLRPRRRVPVMNGALDCRLFVFDLG